MFLDLGPAKNILKNASLSTDWLTPIVTSLAGERAQCLSALPSQTLSNSRTNFHCARSRLSEVIVGVSQSELKGVFFDMFSAKVRSRGFDRMSL